MSLSRNGLEVHCDGPGLQGLGCSSTATQPIGLRRQISAEGEEAPAITGWVFVKHQEAHLHYCPLCVPAYLKSLAESRPLLPPLMTEK